MILRRLLLLLLMMIAAAPASAQQFPKLSGRVVDAANLLSPAEEAAITGKLEGLERASSRQLVVATIPDLQGYPIEDYGYRLGRAWGIGQTEANNGTILIVAPRDRKVRIEVGYGLEPILTDALSSLIVQNQILPRFRANDFPGGINAGVDSIVQQLQAPPELAEQRALAAAAEQGEQASGGEGGSIFPLLFWGAVLFFIIIPMFRGRGRGRRHRRGGFPVVIWGPGFGGGGGGGFGGFGGGGGGGGGFGGFSGGGGSFGGGGASGGW
ncbi:MAG TPA: TPM domain-containing protein [Allosphingosinicella sp.]|jgi:uncharacterized protein